jgi:hypothetical protein
MADDKESVCPPRRGSCSSWDRNRSNAGGGGAYPPPRVEVEVNVDGGGPDPPPGVEIKAMWVEEGRTLLLGSKSR